MEEFTNHELEVLCDKAGISKKGGKEEMYNRLLESGNDPVKASKPKAKVK